MENETLLSNHSALLAQLEHISKRRAIERTNGIFRLWGIERILSDVEAMLAAIEREKH